MLELMRSRQHYAVSVAVSRRNRTIDAAQAWRTEEFDVAASTSEGICH
jgi:hypothetical protein